MRNNPFLKVIIVTSFPDYLDEAMKYHAYRYLSKPIDKNRMFRNLDDAIYLYTQEIKEVAVETKDGFYVLKNIDIIYLETSKRRALIHTVHGDYLSIEKLDYWENELGDASFCRSYRSFIVNMKYVTEFSHDLITLKYNDNEYKAYLNKRKYSEFKHKYLLYKESVR